jgi:hypothetical protein
MQEIISGLVGGEPSKAQYNACHRAARTLIAQGKLQGWLESTQHHPLILLKVTAWIGDHDSGTASERQRAVDPFAEFVDRPWEAFRTDCGYAVEIAEAARALARYDADQVRSHDSR